jgi:hypothetical protein
MKKSKFKILGKIYTALLLISILITSCSGAQEDTLTPEEVLALSADTMKNQEGFSFLIIPEGEDTFVDQQKTIILSQADGDYLVPDKVSATIKIVFSGIVAEVSVISIGENTWETNVLTGGWQKSSASYAFQPLSLLHPETGIIAVIAEDTSELKMDKGAAIEELPGVDLLHLRGTLEGARINQLSAGLIDDETLGVELWITPESYELHRLVITDPANSAEGVDTTWQMDFWNFGTIADIQPPQ